MSSAADRPLCPWRRSPSWPPPPPSPEAIVASRLRVDAVLRALKTLAPERAEALALRVFGGLSVAEAAAVLGKSEAAVKMLMHRATSDLQERLAYQIEADS